MILSYRNVSFASAIIESPTSYPQLRLSCCLLVPCALGCFFPGNHRLFTDCNQNDSTLFSQPSVKSRLPFSLGNLRGLEVQLASLQDGGAYFICNLHPLRLNLQRNRELPSMEQGGCQICLQISARGKLHCAHLFRCGCGSAVVLPQPEPSHLSSFSFKHPHPTPTPSQLDGYNVVESDHLEDGEEMQRRV